MKFHHLGQLLLDTNCLLLVMKMFTMQDVSTTVISKAEWPDEKYVLFRELRYIMRLRQASFFRYCFLNFAKNPQPMRVEDTMLVAPRRTVTHTNTLPNGVKSEEDVDLLTEFSWRNFFSTINYAKIMQKLSKHRSHRIRMLVQYKSAVRSFLNYVYRFSLIRLLRRF